MPERLLRWVRLGQHADPDAGWWVGLMTPRAAHLRAAAAFEIIDEYNQTPPNQQGGVREKNYHAALERLGDAMGTIFGPLPAIRVRGWDDDELGDRDDAIGDELADREGL